MAKSIKQQQAQIGKEFDDLAKIQAEWDKILDKKAKGKKFDEERLKQLEKEYQSYNGLAKKIDGLANTFNDYNKQIEKSNKKIAESVENFDDVEESIKSIGFGIAKNEKLQAAFNSKIDAAKSTLSIVSTILQKQGDLSQEQIDNAEKASESYKKVFTSVGDASKELKRGNITQSEFNDLVKQSYKEFSTLIDNIDDSTESGKKLKKTFEDAYGSMQEFNKAAQKSAIAMDALDTAVDQLGSSGIPIVGELGTAFQRLANKDVKGAKVAITALGAAVGGLAAKYFGAEFTAQIQAANDVKQTQIDAAKDVAKINSDAAFIPQKIALEQQASAIEAGNEINKLNNEAAFAAEKAANSFSASMKMAAAEFQAASKTALFGKGIGSVGYGASQLQMAGISADKIASAMSAAATETGKMPTGKMGADMAIMAERTGQSVGDIAAINEAFQRMDGMSASMAMNMQEGMRNMADQAGIDLGNLMKEVAESSKEALGYQIKSGPALAKAVAYTQSMGVNFGDVAKAGKSMVMNYKDSIKAEMQLSSLLGEQVDLSEVRAKFAAGDTTGALESLKAQGLNPEDMDMFQQQALQDALGGMDLSSLQKISQNQGANVGNLKAGNAAAGNQQFLGAKVAAQASLESQQANIQAQQAIIDASLSEKINQAYLGSKEYLAYQQALVNQSLNQQKLNTEMEIAFQKSPGYIQALADSAKLSIERTFSENIGPALGATVGGILSNYLANIGGKGGGGGAPDAGGLMSSIGGKLKGKKGILGKVGNILSKGGSFLSSDVGSSVADMATSGPLKAAAPSLSGPMKMAAPAAAAPAKAGGGLFSKIGGMFKGAGKAGGFMGKIAKFGKFAKVIPGLSNVLSVGSAIGSLAQGNFASAGMDLLGALPVVGNVLNVARATGLTDGIEGKLNASLGSAFSSIGKDTKATAVAATPATASVTPTTAAATKAPVVDIPASSSIVKTMTDSDKWMQTKLTYMSGNLERIVDRTHKTATSAMELVNESKVMNTNTKAVLELTRKIEALTRATFEGKTEVRIDGKVIATAVANYNDNKKGQNTGTPKT